LVPALEVDGQVIGQSLAIIEYLDETHPVPPLLPSTPAERARVRQIAYAIACDIHPVNNLRLRQYLSGTLKADLAQVDAWYAHWITLGFTALEQMLSTSKATGAFCHGDRPTLADICLVPQMTNAYRFNVPVDRFPTLVRIDKTCRDLRAFADAAPEKQPDAA
jgi:maleylacetoacetate isomerase